MTSDIPAFPPIQDALGALLAGRDWTTTPLGHPDRWPAVVRSTLATWLDSPQPMCMAWGADLRFFFNAAYAPMLGARVGSAMGQPFREVWPDVWADIEPIVERALAGVGSRFDEMPLTMTRNGYPEETWWTFTYQPLRDEEARVIGMLCTTTDVTAQVLGRRQAMRERERQQRLLQQMPGFVAVTTGPGHVFAYVNDAFRRIAGERDFIGGTVRDVFPELASQGFYEMIDAVYATGRPNVVRSHPLRLSGDAQDRYIDLLCQPTFDETGAIHGLFCGGYEVTEGVTATAGLRRLNETLEQRVEERTADLMRAQDALRQSQKLEAVGQLTGGIAHDFNNLLAVVLGGLELARRNIGQDPAGSLRHIDSATEGANRAAALTRRLLAFSREDAPAPEQIVPAALVSGMSDLLDRTLGDAVTLVAQDNGQGWRVRADRTQLENAVLNLAVNARDAMNGRGVLTIVTGTTTLHAGAIGQCQAGDYVTLAVADTGCGMTPDIVERVFEPFFTTKPVGKGTGLGLSQVFALVRQLGGEIGIASQPGFGTTVTLYLPRDRTQPVVAAPAAVVAQAVAAGPLSVLVVEDDPRVLAATMGALEELGHHAVACDDPLAAPALLQRHRDIDLIISDVLMPRQTGPEMIAELGPRHPHIAVLFVTGYAGDGGEAGDFGNHVVLRKPFTLSGIEAAIAAAMAVVRPAAPHRIAAE